MESAFPLHFGIPLNTAAPKPFNWNSADPYLPELIKWMRELDRAVGKWATCEAGTTVMISARHTVGEAAWKEAIKQVAKPGSVLKLLVPVSNNLFTHQYPRLRGIAVSLAGNKINDIDNWSGSIRAPKKAVILGAKRIESAVDQPALVADLARVQKRLPTRQPDFVGTSHMRNLSPISANKPGDQNLNGDSSWVITLRKLSSFGTDILGVDDLILEFLVAAYAGDEQ
jgi:hypothetical protein